MNKDDLDDLVFLAAVGAPRPKSRGDAKVLAVIGVVAALGLAVLLYFTHYA